MLTAESICPILICPVASLHTPSLPNCFSCRCLSFRALSRFAAFSSDTSLSCHSHLKMQYTSRETKTFLRHPFSANAAQPILDQHAALSLHRKSTARPASPVHFPQHEETAQSRRPLPGKSGSLPTFPDFQTQKNAAQSPASPLKQSR